MRFLSRSLKSTLHPHSLSMRVMLSAFLGLLLFSTVVSAILDHRNKEKVLEKYTEKLQLQVYNLLAISEFENNELQIAAFLNDQRLNQKNGDLIAMVYKDDGDIIWDSFSAKNINFEKLPEVSLGQSQSAILESHDRKDFLTQSTAVLWNSEQDAQKLTFLVGLTSKVYNGEILENRKELFLGAVVLIVSILSLQSIILFFGFQNLNTITSDLRAISLGEKELLDGRYPKELQSVSQAINQLILSERTQKDRYQKSLADLAHSLKTPLSVLQMYSDKSENKSLFSEQIERIDQIISYQLKRASHSGSTLGANPIEIKPVIKEINKALGKVYQHKNVSLALNIQEQSKFFGDKNDLMELFGNLMDNAYKHCREKILLDIRQSKNKNNFQLDIRVEDDGHGVESENREFILQRGARADSLNPGQGIGLAVVADIVKAYQGTITVSESSLGGACFHLQFKQTLFT